MTNLFDPNRNYVPGDEELDLLGSRVKLAEWRHKGIGPAFYKLGRKIVYRGVDLNSWAEARRVDPITANIDRAHSRSCDEDAPLQPDRSARSSGGRSTADSSKLVRKGISRLTGRTSGNGGVR